MPLTKPPLIKCHRQARTSPSIPLLPPPTAISPGRERDEGKANISPRTYPHFLHESGLLSASRNIDGSSSVVRPSHPIQSDRRRANPGALGSRIRLARRRLRGPIDARTMGPRDSQETLLWDHSPGNCAWYPSSASAELSAELKAACGGGSVPYEGARG
jgi:hypothetical protein